MPKTYNGGSTIVSRSNWFSEPFHPMPKSARYDQGNDRIQPLVKYIKVGDNSTQQHSLKRLKSKMRLAMENRHNSSRTKNYAAMICATCDLFFGNTSSLHLLCLNAMGWRANKISYSWRLDIHARELLKKDLINFTKLGSGLITSR